MIPTVDQLASDVLTVRAHDLFNPPGLTNFLGALQVDRDPVAIRSVNYPPLFGSDVPTGALFLNGEYVVGNNPPISFTWTPDRVVRDTTVGPYTEAVDRGMRIDAVRLVQKTGGRSGTFIAE